MPFFHNQLSLLVKQKEEALQSGTPYYDNSLLVCRADGEPHNRSVISSTWKRMLINRELPHMRFHDLRHTTATNLHGLTGDFYTVGEILGHTLKGLGLSLGISGHLESVTAQYIDVRLDRKAAILDVYHKALGLNVGKKVQDMKPDTPGMKEGRKRPETSL
jgi:integrase